MSTATNEHIRDNVEKKFSFPHIPEITAVNTWSPLLAPSYAHLHAFMDFKVLAWFYRHGDKFHGLFMAVFLA